MHDERRRGGERLVQDVGDAAPLAPHVLVLARLAARLRLLRARALRRTALALQNNILLSKKSTLMCTTAKSVIQIIEGWLSRLTNLILCFARNISIDIFFL